MARPKERAIKKLPIKARVFGWVNRVKTRMTDSRVGQGITSMKSRAFGGGRVEGRKKAA